MLRAENIGCSDEMLLHVLNSPGQFSRVERVYVQLTVPKSKCILLTIVFMEAILRTYIENRFRNEILPKKWSSLMP